MANGVWLLAEGAEPLPCERRGAKDVGLVHPASCAGVVEHAKTGLQGCLAHGMCDGRGCPHVIAGLWINAAGCGGPEIGIHAQLCAACAGVRGNDLADALAKKVARGEIDLQSCST